MAEDVACEECRELHTHQFRSSSDLINALQVAAAEVDRGALERIQVTDRSIPEHAAIRSAMSSGALPDVVLYRFKCTVCGDTFELSSDTQHGGGGWTRNE